MEDKIKYYDLTMGQDIMLYALRYSFKKSIVNIGASFWFEEGMDIELLEKAIYMSIKRIDALRLRFVKVGKKYQQYVSEAEPKKVEIVDLSKLTEEEIGNKFTKWTSIPLKYKDTEAYDIKIVKVPDNKIAVHFRINHVALDAWGLTIFGRDILGIYSALKEGKELPDPPEPFIPIIKKELTYKDSERYNSDFQFWKDYYKDKPTYCAIDEKNVGKPYRKINMFKFASKLKVYTLPKEKVDIIKEFCFENKLSPQILFLLAARCYFSMMNDYKEEVVISNVSGRRSTAKIKNSTGMLINLILFRVNCSNNMTFLEACNKLAEDQLKLFRHGDFPYQKVTEYVKKTYYKKDLVSFYDMSLTYQLGKIVSEEDMKFKVKTHSNGASGVGIYLTIMDLADEGILDFYFEYNLSYTSLELVSKMYYEMLKVIEYGIKDSKATLLEIMNSVEGNKDNKVTSLKNSSSFVKGEAIND